MADLSQTILEAISQILLKHPDVAEKIEAIAAEARGKGWGAGTVDREVSLAVRLLGRQPSIVVDIGGNVGNYASAVRERVPGAEIHIFEPSSPNIRILNERFATDKLVRVVGAAVSTTSGEAKLYSDRPGSPLGSLTKRKLDHLSIKFDMSENVKTLRFEDYWLNNLSGKPIDIAKIDVEGHEIEVLAGFGSAIKKTMIIQFEFGGTSIDTRTFFKDYWNFFSEHEFNLYRITPYGGEMIKRYTERDECFFVTNYIAVNRTC